MTTVFIFILVIILTTVSSAQKETAVPQVKLPLVINTWNFSRATAEAWHSLDILKSNALDAVEAGCTQCESDQCDHTVGWGGSPDENGESTLDAMLFNGDDMNVGAVAGLRRIKNAASVARKVLENTEHSILVGSLASKFAKQMGFKEESISSNYSTNLWKNWKYNKCQPNFWNNVKPDSRLNCGPYKPLSDRYKPFTKFVNRANSVPWPGDIRHHDTIGMIAIDRNGSIVAGTSSNGANFKIPGRVGDSPIPGAGAYADSRIGAAVATGDGDIMMRFVPSGNAVEMISQGVSPQQAATRMIKRIAQFYPKFNGAMIVVTKDGKFAAACHGFKIFYFSYAYYGKPVTVESIKCM